MSSTMNKCKECNAETKNNKFCNNSCAAKYNNKHRMFAPAEDQRIKILVCPVCNLEFEGNIRARLGTRCDICSGTKLANANKSILTKISPHEIAFFGKFRAITRYNLIINNTPIEHWSRQIKKRQIIWEQDFKCNHCNIDSWNNKPLVLELEHKDGDHNNNKRENLECICPNCHSQTKTWRGRNIKHQKGIIKVSEEKMILAIDKTKNIRQALILVGLEPKGANYSRVNKIKLKHDL